MSKQQPANALAERVPTERFVAVSTPDTLGKAREPAPMRSPAERRRPVLMELQGANPGRLFSLGPPSTLIGRSSRSDIRIGDGTTSWEHVRIVARNGGLHAEDLGSMNGSFVNEQRISSSTLLTDGDYLRLGGGGTVFKFCLMEEFEERALRAVFSLALKDPLTRLYNADYFLERLLGELDLVQRQGTDLAIMLVDIDRFRDVNVRRGQHVGDGVLKLVAGSLQTLTRREDVLTRQKDDEFAILIRGTSSRNLDILAERMLKRVAAVTLEADVGAPALTVSIGIKQVETQDLQAPAQALLEAARSALRAAKSLGGNRVSSAQSSQLA
jgi:diguanylate cyclase (GGDEF)-like protein